MNTIELKGFHFYEDGHKRTIQGVTYGPFRPDEQGYPYPSQERLSRDFEMIAGLGANTVRLYETPSQRVAETAAEWGLLARGHDVTLYATAESRTPAKLRSPVPTSYRDDPAKWDWQLYESFQARQAFEDWRDFKDQEFLGIIGLANRCRTAGLPEIELAINGPKALLRGEGWRCVDAFAISADPWRYHAYLTSSRAEFSVAKHTYVRTRSGWFSGRTICYMASGRPAVVQDTGFSRRSGGSIETGAGLFAWRDEDEAFEAIREVEANYSRHSAAARELAVEHFDDGRVLVPLLENLMGS